MKIKTWIKKHQLVLVFSFLLISFGAFLSLFLFQESDYLWHIKAGQYMVEHHSILTKDIFSWIVPGQYWMSHEWLFEVILYGMKVLFGSSHLFLYVFLTLTSLFLILFFANRTKFQKNIPFSLLWVISFLIFSGFFSGRPHLLSFILLALTIWFLRDFFFHQDSKKIYFLPLIAIIWANVHGGSSNLVYVLCLVFLICGLFQFQFSKVEAKRLSKKQMWTYFIIAIICFGCLCINPHGVRMLSYPYVNLSNDFMQATIAEWQPTDLSNWGHFSYLFLAVLIFSCFLLSKKKIRLLDFILFGIGLFFGLKSTRFWPFIYIFSTFFVFDYIPKRKKDPGTTFLILGLGIFLSIFFLSHCSISYTVKKVIPDSIIQIIKEDQPKRLYNYYDYGGYLISKNIPVFIDGRADLYSDYNYRDYHSISVLSGDYEKLISKYDFDYFLVPTGSSIATYLKYNLEYQKVISEKKVILYKKA